MSGLTSQCPRMDHMEYEVPWLACLLNQFPHLDLTFNEINSTFLPEEIQYRESLVFWVAIPVLWLLLTLLLFLLYFCYRCCQRDVEKKQKVPCLKWTMAILAILACGAVGVGFYGNEEVNNGVNHFSESAGHARSTLNRMGLQMDALQENINKTARIGIDGLKSVFKAHPELNKSLHIELNTLTERALQYAKDILVNVIDINRRANRVDLSSMVRYTKEYNFFRWIGMILLFAWMMLLCLILLLGISRSSKCTLLMFCTFGIFTLVLCWICAGIHLGLSVGLGDFCMSPEAPFERFGGQQVEKDIVRYYIHCNITIAPNPFKEALKSASTNLRESNNTLDKALDIAHKFISKDELHKHVEDVRGAYDNCVGVIMHLTALVECLNLHKDYVDGIEGVCYQTLQGTVFILLSAAITGLLITVLVLMASNAWRHFSRKREAKGYAEVDDDDPFLPRPDNTSPSYYSFARGHREPRSEHVPMHQQGMPPPAYNSNEFYRQYSDVGNIPDERSSEYGGRDTHAT